jgi:hypothetical protein
MHLHKCKGTPVAADKVLVAGHDAVATTTQPPKPQPFGAWFAAEILLLERTLLGSHDCWHERGPYLDLTITGMKPAYV